MAFSFSFALSVPGLTNPFSRRPDAPSPAPIKNNPLCQPPNASARDFRSGAHLDKPVRGGPGARRAPSPLSSPGLSRKRGWVPSSSEPSLAQTIDTSTSGYLDTPSKYRDYMGAQQSQEEEVEEMIADLPPPKRRRTIAGSIVSTALSAALIGTAVGLTVYRLWRDRGRQPEALPPPPYEQGEWVHPKAIEGPSTPETTSTPPPSSPRKKRHVAAGSLRRRGHPMHRKTPTRAHASAHTYPSPPSSSSYAQQTFRAPTSPEFQFTFSEAEEPAEPEVDEQMAWMSDRLAMLIQEGQRALGREVVVLSEDGQDVDDGAPGWVEDDQEGLRAPASGRKSRSLSRASSRRRKIPAFVRDESMESDIFRAGQEESEWMTPEMRESMERARVRVRQANA